MSKEFLDHQCIICGTAYHACDSCRQIKTYTPWRTLCDTFDHYQVYLVIREWQEDFLTKDEAQKKLKGLGVTRPAVYKDWPDGTRGLLNSIFEPTKKIKSEISEGLTPQEVIVEE